MIVEFLFLVSFISLMGAVYVASLLEELEALERRTAYARFSNGEADQ